mmetsp:Transcript_8502/g.27786  ORF Transcript_8502/g.27786 Transcript_8502/m.27786 type:complete len:246 (-) Transcript_8502:349-1086(-)
MAAGRRSDLHIPRPPERLHRLPGRARGGHGGGSGPPGVHRQVGRNWPRGPQASNHRRALGRVHPEAVGGARVCRPVGHPGGRARAGRASWGRAPERLGRVRGGRGWAVPPPGRGAGGGAPLRGPQESGDRGGAGVATPPGAPLVQGSRAGGGGPRPRLPGGGGGRGVERLAGALHSGPHPAVGGGQALGSLHPRDSAHLRAHDRGGAEGCRARGLQIHHSGRQNVHRAARLQCWRLSPRAQYNRR